MNRKFIISHSVTGIPMSEELTRLTHFLLNIFQAPKEHTSMYPEIMVVSRNCAQAMLSTMP
ncbi:MAG: hypothetical protein WBW70_16615 [Candidatus Sulfotelmatobacter sp.]